MKEIVIKLEDDAYDFICSKGYHTQSLYNAIKNGIVLPEQYGRLVDVNLLCEDLIKRWDIADIAKEEMIKAIMAKIVTPIIVSQPTILEGTVK